MTGRVISDDMPAAEVRPALFWDVTQHKIPQDRSIQRRGGYLLQFYLFFKL